MGFGAVFLFGRAGEIVRPIVLPLRDTRVKPAASFITILVERLCDMFAVVVLFALNLLWFIAPADRAAEYADVRKGGLILLIGVVVGLLGLIWFRKYSHIPIKWLDEKLTGRRFVPARLQRLVKHLLEQLAQALSVFTNFRELAATIFWTLLLWMDVLVSTWLVMHAFGLTASLRDALFIMGWALVGSLFPGPGGGAGPGTQSRRDARPRTGDGDSGCRRLPGRGAARTIVMHLVYFAPALLFGFYYFLRSDISSARLRQLASTEPVEQPDQHKPAELAEGRP